MLNQRCHSCKRAHSALLTPGRAAQYRWNVFKGLRDAIDQNEGGLDRFSQGAPRRAPPAPSFPALLHGATSTARPSQGSALTLTLFKCALSGGPAAATCQLKPRCRGAPGYKYYGLNRGEHEGKQGIWYREWAPGARVRRLCRPCMRMARPTCMHVVETGEGRVWRITAWLQAETGAAERPCQPAARSRGCAALPLTLSLEGPGAGAAGRVQRLGAPAGALGGEERLWRVEPVPAGRRGRRARHRAQARPQPACDAARACIRAACTRAAQFALPYTEPYMRRRVSHLGVMHSKRGRPCVMTCRHWANRRSSEQAARGRAEQR